MVSRTFAEKVLSAKSGTCARTGDFVVCNPDLVLGTDGSTPMAIDVFEQMGGRTLQRPDLVLLSRDHYAPPTSDATRGFHSRMEAFASKHGVELLAVGEGIGFRVAMETDRVHPGDLIVGADSHTVTCGAMGAFATGIGSTDLAAALLTGQVWLQVPEAIRVELQGDLPPAVRAQDVALEIVRQFGSEGASYKALEFVGSAAGAFSPDARSVISNMAAEAGAKIGVFAAPEYCSDEDATFADRLLIECSTLQPLVAAPHDPANCVPVAEVAGAPIDWVFLGTCIGGQADDLRVALGVLEAGGISDTVTVVVTPSSGNARLALEQDGSLDRFEALGAIVTETGCGPCCGTSQPIPPRNARVLSTANRNFRGRMGEPSAAVYLASSVTCAAAATTGHVIDPREVA
jgi:3-isopropylmalate/(R)-2-methylmalate dehydratase large subunit